MVIELRLADMPALRIELLLELIKEIDYRKRDLQGNPQMVV